MIHDFKHGERLTHKGQGVTVCLVRRPLRDTGLDEPIYRLKYDSTGQMGNREWTETELSEALFGKEAR